MLLFQSVVYQISFTLHRSLYKKKYCLKMFLIKEFSVVFYLLCLTFLSVKPSQGGTLKVKFRTNSTVLNIVKQLGVQLPFDDNLSIFNIPTDEAEANDDFSSESSTEEDPEIRPHLFQGDIALDAKMQQQMRLGLSWDVFPERKWPNRTIPYTISNLYDAEDRVSQ